MKILVLHTYYNQRGGEDTVFEQECALLQRSNTVYPLAFHNASGLKGLGQFLFSIWNVFAALRLRRIIRDFQPDVIHVHNLHFAVGPIALRTANKLGVPVVVTLHNYRLLCPSATLLHNGQLFTKSLNESFPWEAIKRRVYRNSFFQTFWVAFTIWFHRKIDTWNKVDRYVVLTDFAKALGFDTKTGVSTDKFVLKPNFVAQTTVSPAESSSPFLFVGRLSEEKGIRILLKAFMNNQHHLRVVGDGPLKQEVMDYCEKYKNVRYLGALKGNEVQKLMATSEAIIFPSIWYEGMPMTLLEAFASEAAVLASNIGAMSTIIENGFNGLHFEAGNPESLNEQITRWMNFDKSEKDRYRENAFSTYTKYYTPDKNFDILMDIYNSLVNEKGSH